MRTLSGSACHWEGPGGSDMVDSGRGPTGAMMASVQLDRVRKVMPDITERELTVKDI